MLYPIQNEARNRIDLSGIWSFQVDPEDTGVADKWFNSLPQAIPIAVPGSWNEQYADLYNYLGMAWYMTSVHIPQGWHGQRIFLRVGSANYYAQVWVNGVPVGEHTGGHLPFAFDIADQVKWDGVNLIAIQVENILKPTRVPAGDSMDSFSDINAGYPNTTFDFFPYAGLHRPVILYTVPQVYIEDVTVLTNIEGSSGIVHLRVQQNKENGEGRLVFKGDNKFIERDFTFESGKTKVSLSIPDARFWSHEDPYLYELTVFLINGSEVFDCYTLDVGIRTIVAEGNQILLNGKPIFLKGCGRHEDFYVHGKGLNLPLLVKDYDLMKWLGANSYRTSHYPYSEEEMRMADRCGMLIIDEIPAVSLQFEDNPESIQKRLEQCKQQIRELVARDKNHPSVIMWSIANEPMPPKMVARLTGKEDESIDPEITKFFDELYALTRTLDPSRLVTLVGLMGGPLDWQAPSDVICINRYWGWYTQPGQLEKGFELLGQELDSIYETLGKPIILSEFGADTVAGMHSQPPKMWTEEYQVEMLRGYLDAADARDYVVGAHFWNFADFQAVQSIKRVGGMNLKGVFTRDRKPKMAAHYLRERWSGSAKKKTLTVETTSNQEPIVQEAANSQESIERMLTNLSVSIDGKRPGVTKTLKFDLVGTGIYRLIIIDGKTKLEKGDGEADATMRVNEEDAVKIFSGKLNPMVAVMTGKIKLSGDAMAFSILQD